GGAGAGGRGRVAWGGGGPSAAGPLVAGLQARTCRAAYRLRVLPPAGGGGAGGGADTQLLASSVVTGPPETNLRLSLRTPAAELRGLLGTLPEPDTVNLAALFFSRRVAGRSRRGLPLWGEDSYRRWTRLPWGGTARLYPFGRTGAGLTGRAGRPAPWVEITVGRQFAAGETRASEEVTIVDSTVLLDAQAVIPPRRLTVRMSLVR